MISYTISIIIPAYNEEKKIERDIREAFRFFKSEKLTGEVIVSTDGVTDKTNKIVKRLQEEFKTLSLISVKEKIGKGSAIKKGVDRATGEYIMFADAGLCVPYSFARQGIQLLQKNADCALASRGSSKSKILIAQPLYRKIGSKVFGFLVRSFMGIPSNIRDTQCGFKIYKHDVAKTIFAELNTKSFMFDIELILIAKRYHFKMASFPVDWKNDPDTKFDPISGTIKNLKELLTIKLKFLFK